MRLYDKLIEIIEVFDKYLSRHNLSLNVTVDREVNDITRRCYNPVSLNFVSLEGRVYYPLGHPSVNYVEVEAERIVDR